MEYDVSGAWKGPATPREVIAKFGLEFRDGRRAIVVDSSKATRCYIHHSSVPVALLGYSLASPALAKARFPKTTLAAMVAKRPSMDGEETAALAAIAGVEVDSPSGDPSPFAAHLFDVLKRYKMEPFFMQDDCDREGHYSVRPRGVDWEDDDGRLKAEIKQWRRSFKELAPVDQMMVATVMWLYRGGKDDTWMDQAPNKWHAVDAIITLEDAGYLSDFIRLLILYPGW